MMAQTLVVSAKGEPLQVEACLDVVLAYYL
jgi:hypothetical protein